MIKPAARMKKAVTAPSAIRMIQKSVEASRKASLRRPCCSRSVNTGTKAADSAALANRLLTRLGIWNARVKAEKRPLVPKKLAVAISLTSPTTLEMPVASEKIAVLRATAPPPGGGGGAGGSSPKASALADKAAIVRRCSGAPKFLEALAAMSHGQHPLTEEAHPSLRARASGEPALHLDDQDVLPAPGGARARRRPRGGRGGSSRPRQHDRQGRQARSAAPQYGRPQEVPRGAAAERRDRRRSL